MTRIIRPPADTAPAPATDHVVRRGAAVWAGTHLIIDIHGGDRLDDEGHLRATLLDCVTACGATLLHLHSHRFTPQGITGVAVLAESHMSFHTWPELGYAAFDVFLCGAADPWRAVGVLEAAFAPGRVEVRELRRGEGLAPRG